MVTSSGQRRWLVALMALILGAVALPARAQSSIRFSGGASIDPEQAYAGVAWESPDIGGRFRLRPGIDGGFGSGLRMGAINIDLVVRFPIGQTGWSLVQGGGPTITITTLSGDYAEGSPKDLHAGGSYLFGFAHDSGFFTEFRIGGGGYVPGLKIGAGWSVKIQ